MIKRIENIMNEQFEERIISLIQTKNLTNIDLALKLAKNQKIDVDSILEKHYAFSWFSQYIRFPQTMLKYKIMALLGIKVLDLANENITRLPKEIGYLTDLEILNLSNNQLKELPNEIGHLTKLEDLSLKNNLLTNIPNSINQLTRLMYIDLSDNCISTFPKELLKLGNPSYIDEFSIANNPIQFPPKEIPGNYIEFLHWFKQKTESFFQQDKNKSEWFYDIKWKPLTEQEIDYIEKKYSITFSYQHRAFLKVLHATNKQLHKWKEGDDEVYEMNKGLCHDWLEDDENIKKYLTWPYDYSGDKWRQKYENIAPKLVPINGHCFVMNEPENKLESPVLSVWDASDVFIWGWNMKSYLLKEFFKYLGIENNFINEKGEKCFQESDEYLNQEHNLMKYETIPIWYEVDCYNYKSMNKVNDGL